MMTNNTPCEIISDVLLISSHSRPFSFLMVDDQLCDNAGGHNYDKSVARIQNLQIG